MGSKGENESGKGGASEREFGEIAQGVAEVGGDGGGEGGVGVLVEGGVFGGAATEPGTEGSGVVGGDFLGEQGS